MNKKQAKNLKRIVEVADEGPGVFLRHISELEDSVDERIGLFERKVDISIAQVDKKASQAMSERKQGKQGERGESGQDGKDGKNGRDGRDGRDGVNGVDGKDGVNGVDGKDGSKGEPGAIGNISPQELRDLLELLQDDERLDAKYIRGLEGLAKAINPPNGPMLHTPSIGNLPDVSIAGILSGQTIQWDGIKFVPVTASGSGFQQPTSGALGQNVFVWASAPNVIVIDNIPYQKTSTDGTVNWTGTTTTTLTIKPLSDIYSPS